MKRNIIISIILLAFLNSCLTFNKKEETNNDDIKLKNKQAENIIVDYSKIKYALPQSNYAYDVQIIGIETQIKKNAFKTKADQYSVSKNVDGLNLTLTYTMTNPYEKEMMAPVPNYYYITSENEEWFSDSTTNHRLCHCHIDNSTEVTDSKGNRLFQISEGKCGYGDYCIKFKPKETKEFKIKFTDPFIGDLKTIVFNGFNMSWNNPSYSREQDKGLIIDLEHKKIIGEKKF